MVELQPSKLITWVRFPSPAYKNFEKLSVFTGSFFVSSIGKFFLWKKNKPFGHDAHDVPRKAALQPHIGAQRGTSPSKSEGLGR